MNCQEICSHGIPGPCTAKIASQPRVMGKPPPQSNGQFSYAGTKYTRSHRIYDLSHTFHTFHSLNQIYA